MSKDTMQEIDEELDRRHNRRMAQKLSDGRAIDVGRYPQNGDGDFILPPDLCISNIDLCADGDWIWSVGTSKKTGERLASKLGKFYEHPDFDCEWLR